MLEISQLFAHGFFKKDMERLNVAGFHIRVETFGINRWQISRFIDFQKGPSLEFIEVLNETEYLESLSKEIQAYAPGICLNITNASSHTIADYEKEFIHLKPFIVHANYDEQLETRGPGWNYLNFEKSVMKNTVVGLKSYEMPRPERISPVKDHSNRVEEVVGLILNLKAEEIKNFIQLTKADTTHPTPLVSGIKIFTKETLSDFSFENRKEFPLSTVILKTNDFSHFDNMKEKPFSVKFRDYPARLIKTHELAWDLLIIQ